jgi:hypothetical protein
MNKELKEFLYYFIGSIIIVSLCFATKIFAAKSFGLPLMIALICVSFLVFKNEKRWGLGTFVFLSATFWVIQSSSTPYLIPGIDLLILGITMVAIIILLNYARRLKQFTLFPEVVLALCLAVFIGPISSTVEKNISYDVVLPKVTDQVGW